MGRVFDPIADKLLVGALLMCLVANGTIVGIDLIPATAIILRELLISGLREYLGAAGHRAAGIETGEMGKPPRNWRPWHCCCWRSCRICGRQR